MLSSIHVQNAYWEHVDQSAIYAIGRILATLLAMQAGIT